MRASSHSAGKTIHFHIELTNTGLVASLANKLTLLSAKTKLRALPAYYSDNYISLLPGQTQAVDIETPAEALNGPAEIALRGWNIVANSAIVK